MVGDVSSEVDGSLAAGGSLLGAGEELGLFCFSAAALSLISLRPTTGSSSPSVTGAVVQLLDPAAACKCSDVLFFFPLSSDADLCFRVDPFRFFFLACASPGDGGSPFSVSLDFC